MLLEFSLGVRPKNFPSNPHYASHDFKHAHQIDVIKHQLTITENWRIAFPLLNDYHSQARMNDCIAIIFTDIGQCLSNSRKSGFNRFVNRNLTRL